MRWYADLSDTDWRGFVACGLLRLAGGHCRLGAAVNFAGRLG